MVNYAKWNNFFRSLISVIENDSLGSEYSFDGYHVTDVGNFQADGPDGILDFLELEKSMQNQGLAKKIRDDFTKIFTKRLCPVQVLPDIKTIADFCATQAEAQRRLPLNKFYDLIETVTGLESGREIAVYLKNILS